MTPASGRCRAALMTRPMLERDAGASRVLHTVSDTEVRLEGIDVHGASTEKVCKFDAVPSDARALFESCVKPTLLPGVLSGYNGTIFAYGQTGSGKTFTMGSGAAEDAPDGLIQLTVRDLFASLPKDAEVKVTFVQIYREEAHDLLVEDSSTCHLKVREVESKKFSACGATSLVCSSAEAVLKALHRGVKNRCTGPTRMNAESSRSHALLTLHLSMANSEETGGLLKPKLHFVDLAGSERCNRAGTSGRRLKEGISINVSLQCLGHVIDALASKERREQGHVPYRNSTLTLLLADSLGGSSQTLMVACASPAEPEYAETANTLWYASRVRGITNNLKRVRVASGVAAKVTTITKTIVKEVAVSSAEETKLRLKLMQSESERLQQASRIEQLELQLEQRDDALRSAHELVPSAEEAKAKLRLELKQAESERLEQASHIEQLELDLEQRDDALRSANEQLVQSACRENMIGT